MAPPRNETQLVHAIERAILREWPDAWVMKVHGSVYQRVGLPDLLVCIAGHLAGLEIKHVRPGETPAHARNRASAVQLAELAKLRAAGAIADVVLTPDEAVATLKCLVRGGAQA